ncbi:hypothetical protein KIPB_013965, partial [Kipferlia bialata]|eukprot:g13965.t1
MRHGWGTATWSSGAVYEGEWVGGRCQGYGAYNDGTKLYLGQWMDGVPHGLGMSVLIPPHFQLSHQGTGLLCRLPNRAQRLNRHIGTYREGQRDGE